MLVDLHGHTSGISVCCRAEMNEVIRAAKSVGLDGIALTNHYQKTYLETGREMEFVEKYIKEYEDMKKVAENEDFKVFWGIEVTMEHYPKVHLLIYGVPTSFLKEHPFIFDLTQEELYALVKEAGGVLIQAHPYRGGTHVLDPKFLDGVEINSHPLYNISYADELLLLAEKEKLAVTSGGDYHADTYRPKCGVYLPDDIKDSKDIADFLLNEREIKLCIQEPNTPEAYDTVAKRSA